MSIQNMRDAVKDLEGLKAELDQFNRVRDEHTRVSATHAQSQLNHNILLSQLTVSCPSPDLSLPHLLTLVVLQ